MALNFDEALDKYVSGAADQDELPPAYESGRSPAVTSKHELLSITIDGNLIFPSLPPAQAMYELSRALDKDGIVSVERVDHTGTTGADGQEIVPSRNKLVYEFHHPIAMDHIAIAGKRPGTHNEVWLNEYWELFGRSWVAISVADNSEKRLLYRAQSEGSGSHQRITWKDATGRALMTEMVEVSPDGSTQQILHTLDTLETNDVDILVTLWCARIWAENMAQMRKAKSKKGDKGILKGVARFFSKDG